MIVHTQISLDVLLVERKQASAEHEDDMSDFSKFTLAIHYFPSVSSSA